MNQKQTESPFQGKSVHLVAIFTAPLNAFYLNGEILKSQKLLAKLTFKEYFKLATKSYINCPINVVSYAQIALKKG